MNERMTLKEILGGLLVISMFYLTTWMFYLVAPESVNAQDVRNLTATAWSGINNEGLAAKP